MFLTACASFFCLQAPLAFVTLACAQTPVTDAQQPLPAAGPKAVVALVPGALPADATPEARATWMAAVEALRPKNAADAATPITAFDWSISMCVTSLAENGGKQKNDVKVRYQYLAPDFVCSTMLETKVKRMRGPDGDWLWDPEKNDLVKLVGKDFAQDRRELAQMQAVARTNLALGNPGSLRIARLERLKAPPACLPKFDPKDGPVPKESALPLAASLEWISITSPDFRVVEPLKSTEPPMFRAQIGLDPKSHLPLIAVIWQDERGAMVAETATLVDFVKPENFQLIDGHLAATFFREHDPLLPSSPFTFQREARIDVFVYKSQSTLRPKLTPDDFRPPKK